MTFTRPDAWSGGDYELAIVLGPADDDRRTRALAALWSFRDLEGCYLDPEIDPTAQPRLAPTTEHDLLYGLARLTSDPLPCRSVAIRFDESREDWLWLGIAMGSLARILPVGSFPFAGPAAANLAWRLELDAWFVRLARHVFETVPFRLALVGWTDPSELDDVERFDRDTTVPDERWVGYVVPRAGDLDYYPPTRGAPLDLPRRR